MTLDLRALLEETGALLTGHFRLSSGLHSPNYVQCAKLLEHPRNANAIGAALGERVRTLGAQKIVAPALGGVIIGYTVAAALDLPSIFTERKDGAMTLRRGFAIGDGERVVIVEDVVTTGKSTRETADVVAQHGGVVAGFASILNRSGRPNPFDAPYESLLALSLETYEESACPLCARGVALDAPGSRYSR
ncbi:MAG: orotate phosphoribosyltransferase [Acidobacteria bacterium]|nr:orotate phosphoribosyltransferase [Acidobacteriota bacterium]MBV9475877.1 orotate phosphoribosyltransferase [Acidobacteriota bacterium]